LIYSRVIYFFPDYLDQDMLPKALMRNDFLSFTTRLVKFFQETSSRILHSGRVFRNLCLFVFECKSVTRKVESFIN
jgi:hypothetical protein